MRGVVEFDSGFENAAIAFTPSGGRPAKGVISPQDGSFVLTTYHSGDGAKIGHHSVAVSATVSDPSVKAEDKYPGIRSTIPENFSNRDTSNLSIDVEPGENVIKIEINSDGTGLIIKE